MFRRMLRHEWRTLSRDATLWVLVGVFALAIGYATVNGARWVRFQQQAIADAEHEERERFAVHEAQILRINRGEVKVSPFADPRNPETVGRRLGGRYASLPPAPLAALSIGQSDLLPSYFKITTDAKETVTASAELENPHRLLAGRFDLAFVLIYLYPLLILALSYNLLSAEKEQGTLVLALSQPVSGRTLVLAKVTIRFLIFLAIIAVLAVAALLMVGVDLTSGAVLVRLPLWLGAMAAYGLFWFALAIASAARGHGSATNAMTLASIWLALVVLLPSMFNLLATTAYPVPSRVDMIQAVREASDQANEEGSRLLSKYYDDHPELAEGGAEQAMKDFNVIRVAVNAEVERRVRPVIDAYERQLHAQQQMIDLLRFLSPAILMQDALNDISGTGVARHRAFMQQVSAYHAAWRGYFVPRIFRKAQLASFGELPQFRYRDEPWQAVTNRVAASVLGFLLPAAAIGVFGLWSVRRYRVAG
jgi:ABC-2 type transport system permease protein